MSFNPNVPQPLDELSDSQGDLLTNFGASDTSFGINHYKFSNLTVDNGKHTNVQTPNQITHPSTIAAEPALYGMQDTAPIGVIQYSRGPSDAVPTPVTKLQSTSALIVLAPATTTNVLDFTGLSRALCMLYAAHSTTPSIGKVAAFVIWNGVALTINVVSTGASVLVAQASGNVLQLRNAGLGALNVFWTLDMQRVQV